MGEFVPGVGRAVVVVIVVERVALPVEVAVSGRVACVHRVGTIAVGALVSVGVAVVVVVVVLAVAVAVAVVVSGERGVVEGVGASALGLVLQLV